MRLLRRSTRFSVASVCLGVATILSVAGCSAQGEAQFVGREIQVTHVYDDPALPTAAPENAIPPMITFGGRTYTVTSQCGTATGEVDWRGEAAVVDKPEPQLQRKCSPAMQTFVDRLFTQLDGEYTFDANHNSVRFARVEKPTAGEAPAGWAGLLRTD